MQSQVRFNRVSEEGSGEGLGSFGAEPGSTGFRRRFWRRSGRLWCGAIRFNRVPEKVPEKVPGGFGEPGQVQQGSGEGLGGFGAEPGQVQHGSGEGSGEDASGS